MIHAGVTYHICIGWTSADPKERKYTPFIVDTRDGEIAVMMDSEPEHEVAKSKAMAMVNDAGGLIGTIFE